MLDFSLELIAGGEALTSLSTRLTSAPAVALDIETVNWWDRDAERVSLIQFAFREEGRLRVGVVDALGEFDAEPLRAPLELSAVPKVIHNAAFDASRLSRHFRLRPSPIHDTMLAARRRGEKCCSLQAQAQSHLGVSLDKSEQRGDWGRRPLAREQLSYAALDAACTLLLFENQTRRGLSGSYRLRDEGRLWQSSLPLDGALQPEPAPAKVRAVVEPGPTVGEGLDAAAVALLGVLTELPGRYGPERLAASSGADRVGVAGWIIDRALGQDADLDEDTVKFVIAELCERGLVRLDEARRLEATETGARLWHQLKSGLDLPL